MVPVQKKQGGPAGWDSQQIKQRAEIIADIEGASKHLQNVRFEEAKQGAKDGVIGAIKGDVEIELNGKKIHPEVVYRANSNGDVVLHDVTKINRSPTTESPNHNPRRHFEPSRDNGQSSDSSTISQNSNNVNNGITRLVDLGYDDRASAIHEISDIKRTTIGSNEPVRRDNFRKNSGSQSLDR